MANFSNQNSVWILLGLIIIACVLMVFRGQPTERFANPTLPTTSIDGVVLYEDPVYSGKSFKVPGPGTYTLAPGSADLKRVWSIRVSPGYIVEVLNGFSKLRHQLIMGDTEWTSLPFKKDFIYLVHYYDPTKTTIFSQASFEGKYISIEGTGRYTLGQFSGLSRIESLIVPDDYVVDMYYNDDFTNFYRESKGFDRYISPSVESIVIRKSTDPSSNPTAVAIAAAASKAATIQAIKGVTSGEIGWQPEVAQKLMEDELGGNVSFFVDEVSQDCRCKK